MIFRALASTSYMIMICNLILFGVVLSTKVDFSKVPDCARGNCFPYHSSSIGCPQLTTSCFCNALAPINCASQNCTGKNWYAVEDWFATQCPNPPNVTFSGLPECSRECIRDAIIPAYCEAQVTRNCFCRLEVQFESLIPCLASSVCNETIIDANKTLAAFYRETCIYDPNTNGDGGQNDANTDQGADQIIESPDESSGGGSVFDKFQNVIGLAASLSALVGGFITFWIWLNRRTEGGIPGGNLLDPPPAYEAINRGFEPA